MKEATDTIVARIYKPRLMVLPHRSTTGILNSSRAKETSNNEHPAATMYNTVFVFPPFLAAITTPCPDASIRTNIMPSSGYMIIRNKGAGI